MWFYLQKGFYSVVHKPPCKKDELLVRARCKVDIERLSEKLSQTYNFKGTVIESPKSDYAYRMIVPREILASFMANTVTELNYGNFKETIPEKDYIRRDAYLRCWKVMYDWQKDVKKLERRERL